MIAGLLAAMEARRLAVATGAPGAAILKRELEAVAYLMGAPVGGRRGGCHDDAVMALALAVTLAKIPGRTAPLPVAARACSPSASSLSG